jgi:hypothetical protein
MIERYRTNCGRGAGDTPATERASQTAPDLPSETRRITDRLWQYPAEQDGGTRPPSDRANPLAWELIASWILVLLSFAALIFAVYVIWAKCEGHFSF